MQKIVYRFISGCARGMRHDAQPICRGQRTTDLSRDFTSARTEPGLDAPPASDWAGVRDTRRDKTRGCADAP